MGKKKKKKKERGEGGGGGGGGGGKTNTYEIKLLKAEGQRPVDRCGHGSEFKK